jgi:hypothetical protein
MPVIKTKEGYRVYEFNGIRYPSVTTILSNTAPPEETASLRAWAANFYMPGFSSPEEYTRYTAIRGTIVHYNVLNSIVRNLTKIQLDSSEIPPRAEWAGRAEKLAQEVAHCRGMWDDLGLKISFPLKAESANYHPELRYAGTLDLYCRIDGVKTILDLKTSSKIRDKQVVQVSAYTLMQRRWDPSSVEQGMVVSLNPGKKKPIVKIIEEDELQLNIDEFKERLATYWAMPSTKRYYG